LTFDVEQVTVRFGSFYTVDIDASLPATQRTLPLEEFLAACEQGRGMRKVAERGEFRAVRKPRERLEYKMVPVPKVSVGYKL
jgi:hypothetical protein